MTTESKLEILAEHLKIQAAASTATLARLSGSSVPMPALKGDTKTQITTLRGHVSALQSAILVAVDMTRCETLDDILAQNARMEVELARLTGKPAPQAATAQGPVIEVEFKDGRPVSPVDGKSAGTKPPTTAATTKRPSLDELCRAAKQTNGYPQRRD